MKNLFNTLTVIAIAFAAQSASALERAKLAQAMHDSTVEMIDLESANRQHVGREAKGEGHERMVFSEDESGEVTVITASNP